MNEVKLMDIYSSALLHFTTEKGCFTTSQFNLKFRLPKKEITEVSAKIGWFLSVKLWYIK